MARAIEKKSVARSPRSKGGKRPAKKSTTTSDIYGELRSDIVGLKLEPGTLLDETELAKRFHVSRSPIREALIRLSAEGLVQTLRNRSSIVAPFDIVVVSSYIDALILVYRLTSRLAALMRKPSQLVRIKESHELYNQAIKREDAPGMVQHNFEFHMAIAEAAGNSFYLKWTRQLLEQGQRIVGLYLHEIGDHIADRVISEHSAIVRAIEKQDADGAENAAMRDAEILTKKLHEWFVSKPSMSLATARPIAV